MAKKKTDGGAARAESRKRVYNKKQEEKYGLQGFVARAEASRNWDKPQDIAMAGIEAYGVRGVARGAQALGDLSSMVGAKGIPTYLSDATRMRALSIKNRKLVGNYLRNSGRFDEGWGMSVLREIDKGTSTLTKKAQKAAKSEIVRDIRKEIKNVADRNAAGLVVVRRAGKIMEKALKKK